MASKLTRTYKAAKNKSEYKNTNAWLDAVYRNNKTDINRKLSIEYEGALNKVNYKTIFKHDVKVFMQKGMTAKEAVKAVASSATYKGIKEIGNENAFSAIKADTNAYNQLRKLSGWRTAGKITAKNFTYVGDNQYLFTSSYLGYSVLINFKNSPVEIRMTKLTPKEAQEYLNKIN